jgi:heme-degrading monooxygenase HmoA
MFLRAWQFRPARGREAEFERVYGPSGDWAQLFATAPGFLRTELLKATDSAGDYLIVDRWESMEAWETFHREQSAAYSELDRRFAAIVRSETLIGEYSAITTE